jgi:hypothetical protein
MRFEAETPALLTDYRTEVETAVSRAKEQTQENAGFNEKPAIST